MAGLNRVELMGNLTANAVVRYTQSGQPVTSMRKEGSQASRADVVAALARSFSRVFDREIAEQES